MSDMTATIHRVDELVAATDTNVALSGIAIDYKAGAALVLVGERAVFLDGVNCWPVQLRGKHVRACGMLRYSPAASVDPGVTVQHAVGDRWSLACPIYEQADAP